MKKYYLAFCTMLALLFTVQSTWAATELEIVDWLKPLMGTHSLNGTNDCKKISFENITEKWDRYAIIRFSVGIAGDVIYQPTSNKNCDLISLANGSQLDCKYTFRSGALGQKVTRIRVSVAKDTQNKLKVFYFNRFSFSEPAANYSARCN